MTPAGGAPNVLAACPFCGGKPKVESQRVAEDCVETWVKCDNCFATTDRIEGAYSEPGMAASLWNTRTIYHGTAALNGSAAQEVWINRCRVNHPRNVCCPSCATTRPAGAVHGQPVNKSEQPATPAGGGDLPELPEADYLCAGTYQPAYSPALVRAYGQQCRLASTGSALAPSGDAPVTRMVTIKTAPGGRSDGKVELGEVPALMVTEHFAVHADAEITPIGRMVTGDGFGVTHLPTGLNVAWSPYMDAAIAGAKAIAGLPVDWARITPADVSTLTKDIKDQVQAIRKAARLGDAAPTQEPQG